MESVTPHQPPSETALLEFKSTLEALKAPPGGEDQIFDLIYHCGRWTQEAMFREWDGQEIPEGVSLACETLAESLSELDLSDKSDAKWLQMRTLQGVSLLALDQPERFFLELLEDDRFSDMTKLLRLGGLSRVLVVLLLLVTPLTPNAVYRVHLMLGDGEEEDRPGKLVEDWLRRFLGEMWLGVFRNPQETRHTLLATTIAEHRRLFKNPQEVDGISPAFLMHLWSVLHFAAPTMLRLRSQKGSLGFVIQQEE